MASPGNSTALNLTTATTIESISETVAAQEMSHSSSETDPLLSTTSAGTILYLAYGSNLSASTFREKRGIKPLSSKVVHVPSLTLTFDLPGMPYVEPCFANTKYRDPSAPPTKSPYHKDHWQKGLIGVVYEVTPEDYRTIIATEGGGASYHDVLVDCFALPAGAQCLDAALEDHRVPFKAHTLLAPHEGGNRNERRNPSYAQPSARYLGLLVTGGEEHSLPADYMAYLREIRPFRITTYRQSIGRVLFLGVWAPVLLFVMVIGKSLSDKDGKTPKWLADLTTGLFRTVWRAYDFGFKRLFGNGERTIGDEEEDAGRFDENRDVEKARGSGWKWPSVSRPMMEANGRA